MSSETPRKRNDKGDNSDPFRAHVPAIDEFGLPLYTCQAQSVMYTSDGPLGEGSNMRSIAMDPPSFGGGFDSSLLAPPSLTSQRSVGGVCGLYGDMCLEPPSLKPQESLSLIDTPFGSNTNKTSTSATANPAIWVLPEGSINPVPDFYPLEQSAVFIEGDSPANIASRISDCLRRRSIAASYGNEKAKAKCKTEDGVEFVVRMFYGRGDYSHGVIVEVQRRCGWSPSFQQDVFAILESAEDKEVNDFDISLPPMDDFLNDMHDDGFDFTPHTEVSNPIPHNLVLSDNIDVKMMGFQILCSVTDMTKVGSATALKNANSIVHGQEEIEVRKMLIEMLVKKDLCYDKALKVISNCVEVMTKENALACCMLEDAWLLDKLIPSLVKELHDAEDTPNEAAVAAKCLSNIMSASTEAGQKALGLGAISALSKANNIGSAMHCHLEKEASRGVTILECF